MDIRLGSFCSVSDFLNVTIEVGRSVLVVLHLMSIFSTSVWAHSAPHNCVSLCRARDQAFCEVIVAGNLFYEELFNGAA